MIKGAQSIYRTVDLIKLLLKSRDGLSARELSERTDVPFSTTHRILTVLCEKGLVQQNPSSRLYTLGYTWISDPLMERHHILYNLYGDIPSIIVREFGYTGYLYGRIGYSYRCITRAEGFGAVQILSSYQGEIRYLGDGAGSFGILAFLDEAEKNAILEANLPLFRDRLLRSEAEMREVLNSSARNGYVFGNDFRVSGTAAVAVPIWYQNEVIGAVSVSGMYDEVWKKNQDFMVSRMQERVTERRRQ